MSIQGKVFAIQADGKELRLTKEVDGDVIPLPSVPVVILGFNPARGRAYYENTFDQKSIKPPTCWSRDGVAPDDTVAEKQSDRCATCKMAVKGSRVSDNDKALAACQEHRLVCLVPYKALHTDMPPLRLRVPPTSDYDGRNTEAKAKDMYAFSQFIDFIRSRGVMHSYEMVVKMSFDTTPGITYPKLWFQAQGWVDENDAARIKQLREDGGVDIALSAGEGEVAAAAAAAQQPDAAPITGTARAGTTTARKPKAAETKPKAAEQPKPAELTPAQKAKAAAAAAAAEAERLEAEEAAQAGGAGITMNLGDDDDAGTKAAAAPSTTGNGTVDTKAPPAAVHADDKDVDDIMQQWAGD